MTTTFAAMAGAHVDQSLYGAALLTVVGPLATVVLAKHAYRRTLRARWD
ncbi:hypothetical protein [Nonomuraea basaltis]|nr:hypothetical protein [Nonomuraea basaltis]